MTTSERGRFVVFGYSINLETLMAKKGMTS